jgi:Protein of unknown function (DUF3105)
VKWFRMTSAHAPSALVRTVRTLAIVTVAVGLLACGGDDDDPTSVSTVVDGEEVTLDAVVTERAGDYTHVLADLDYDRPAPSGGDHPPAPYWLTCGVYEGAVPDELAVHSLEHGAVWIALGPDSTDADRAAATDLAEGRKVIVSDVPDLPNPVEAVAWGFRLPLESADDPRLGLFVDTFIDASTAPEAGSSCASIGTPPNPPALPTS